MGSPGFSYAPAIAERYPQVRAEVVLVEDFDNRYVPPALAEQCATVQSEVAADLAGSSPAELDSIKAWRSVFSSFGVKPTQYRNAAEALLRRLGRHGDIPSINSAVDIGNLVSIRHALPVAAFDVGSIAGPLVVTFATGTEPFVGIGADEIDHPAAGEVVFLDEAGQVAARRWCWKQSDHSATGRATRAVMYVIEGVHSEAPNAVSAAALDLEALMAAHQPSARCRRASVTPDHPDARFD